MKKGNKKALLKVLVVASFVFVFIISSFCFADVGDFNSYSGGGGSSYSSSSSHHYGSGHYRKLTKDDLIVAICLFAYLFVLTPIWLWFCFKLRKIRLGKNTKRIENKVKKFRSEFSGEDFLNFAKDLFVKMQYAWNNRDFEAIRSFETKELFEQHSTQLNRYIQANKINVMKNVETKDDSYICNYKRDGSVEVITVIIRAEMNDYIIDADTKKVLEGIKSKRWDRKYRLKFIRTIEEKNSNGNTTNVNKCPNCGAEIKIDTPNKCEFCGTLLTNDKYNDWVLSSLESI